jgi:hypothetical protein
MRLIIRLQPSALGRSLARVYEECASEETLRPLEDENERHVLDCAERVRREIPPGGVLRPLPRSLLLLVECPNGKAYRLRENILASCPDVELITEDREIQLID